MTIGPGMIGGAAAFATVWAFVLALAGQAAGMGSGVADLPTSVGGGMPVGRALRLARLALLVVAGATLGLTVRWWTRPMPVAVLVVAASALLLVLVGDMLPRVLGALLPASAARTLPLARASLLPFRPLLGVLGFFDASSHRAVPPTAVPRRDLGVAQRDMLLGVLSLEDTSIEDVMTPRLDIEAVSLDASWSELLDIARRSEHSRLPVYREVLDDIAGLIHAKDLAPGLGGSAPPPERWQDLIRPVPFVPESKLLSRQLRDFQRGGGHLVIVVDEFGGTSGLVTLEDVLEEIVGEIHDEYDVNEEPEIEREGNDRFWVNGRVTLDDLSATLGAAFSHEDVSTVGGLIYAELGRVPRPGEELTIGGFRVVVEQVVRRRIRRVYFERLARTGIRDADPAGVWEDA